MLEQQHAVGSDNRPVAGAMIGIMLVRPRGLWPSPEHGKAAPAVAAK